MSVSWFGCVVGWSLTHPNRHAPALRRNPRRGQIRPDCSSGFLSIRPLGHRPHPMAAHPDLPNESAQPRPAECPRTQRRAASQLQCSIYPFKGSSKMAFFAPEAVGCPTPGAPLSERSRSVRQTAKATSGCAGHLLPVRADRSGDRSSAATPDLRPDPRRPPAALEYRRVRPFPQARSSIAARPRARCRDRSLPGIPGHARWHEPAPQSARG